MKKKGNLIIILLIVLIVIILVIDLFLLFMQKDKLENSKEYEENTNFVYQYKIGDIVYIDDYGYKIENITDKEVILYDDRYPDNDEKFLIDDFNKKLKENKANDDLKVNIENIEKEFDENGSYVCSKNLVKNGLYSLDYGYKVNTINNVEYFMSYEIITDPYFDILNQELLSKDDLLCIDLYNNRSVLYCSKKEILDDKNLTLNEYLHMLEDLDLECRKE